MLFNCLSTDHGRGPQSYRGLADLLGIYFPPSDSVYLVPVSETVNGKGTLRLEPTLNNQRRRIRFAETFSIDRWAREDLEIIASGETLTAPGLSLSVA